MSNLADRFFRHHHGAVVDFISLVSWWATFNVADAAITIGALTLAVSLVFFPGRSASPAMAQAPTAGARGRYASGGDACRDRGDPFAVGDGCRARG